MSTNGWGKGSVNNTNGWGAGAINNDIGWGDSQLKSWSGDTDIDGGTGIPVNTVAPVISGTTTLGSVLTTTNGTWTAKPAATYTYQWKRNGLDIDGATNSTYTLVNEDGASNIFCKVTATNEFGFTSVNSNTLAIPAFTDADAQAFITAAAITNPTQQSAINQLVTDLKGYGVWTKMKALYPFIGGTASSHSYNLKNTSQFQITWNGGVTHSSTGVTFNGTNGFGNTNMNPRTTLGRYSNHLSFYYRNTASQTGYSGCGSPNWFIIGNEGGLFQYRPNGGASMNFSPTGGTFNKMIIGTRRADNDNELYENGISRVTDTAIPALELPTFNLLIGAANNSGTPFSYSNQNMAMFTIGDGLTDTEAANFYTAVQTFQTALNRQV